MELMRGSGLFFRARAAAGRTPRRLLLRKTSPAARRRRSGFDEVFERRARVRREEVREVHRAFVFQPHQLSLFFR